jgi:hypothetical protein
MALFMALIGFSICFGVGVLIRIRCPRCGGSVLWFGSGYHPGRFVDEVTGKSSVHHACLCFRCGWLRGVVRTEDAWAEREP